MRNPFESKPDVAAILQGAALALFLQVVGAGTAYLSVVLLARWMGAAEFGIYGFALAWIVPLATVASLGLPTANIRFVAQYRALDDWPAIRGLSTRSRALTACLGLVIAGAGAIGTLLASPYLDPAFVRPLVVAFCSLPLLGLIRLRSAMARGFGWAGIAFGPALIMTPALLVVFSLLLRHLSGTLTALQAVLATLTAYAVVLIVLEIVLAARLGPVFKRVVPSFSTRTWLRVALPLLLYSGAVVVILHLDSICIGLMLTAEDVGIYTTATRTAFLATYALQAVNAMAAPRLSVYHAKGQSGALPPLLKTLSQWIFWPTLAIVLGEIAFGRSILGLFGGEFGAGYPALVVLALGHLATAAAGPAPILLAMTGHQNDLVIVYGAAIALNLAANVVLIPIFGLQGAALATAGTFTLSSLALVLLAVKRLRVNPSVTAAFIRIPARR